MNTKALITLEYDKIIKKLETFASSTMGKKLCKDLLPSSDYEEILSAQTETKDALTRLYKTGYLSFQGLSDIRPHLKLLEIDSTLNQKELLEIARLLSITAQAVEYGDTEDEVLAYDSLNSYFGELDPLEFLYQRITQCILSEDEISDALEIIKELASQVCQYKREPIPASELIIGMKCGGSDGLSGITANPTVGAFSDLLISKGGTTILTEVPEMFGAETLLMNRCETEELFDKTVRLVNNFKNYFKSHNQTIYENPSPGNKKGGISTLEDKSLGCTQKSGSAPVKGVLSYGEPVKVHGLNLLSAPGNDLVASTALAASGAHIVLFTTGRGTPFASPVPTIKIASNSALASKKSNWIDFNCGVLVEDKTTDELSKNLFNLVIDIASGKKSKSEEAGFHDMAIFKQGVTL